MRRKRECLIVGHDGMRMRLAWAETRFCWLILLGARVTLGPERAR